MPRTCPTDADLAAFQRGEINDELLDQIADHLEACESCTARMRTFDEMADPVVAALRHGASSTLDLTAAVPGPSATDFVLPQLIGPYEILGELGRGGMGVVFRARHLKLQRIVALKMLRGGRFSKGEERVRFERETAALARLQHPHIVQLFETGEFEGEPYFTLELVDGGSLNKQLSGKPWPARRAAAVVETLAGAVAHAHQQGIVHRDLKPANILLDESGDGSSIPKIADFGVARLLHGTDGKTQTGLILGTPEYMAPEQTEGSGNAGPAADIYALGTILYELLTGRPPFRADTPLGTIRQVQTLEPIRVTRLQPGVPRDLETICLKCLEKEAEKRYATARDLADDCAAYLRGEPIRARPITTAERALKWVRRRPSLAAALGALVFVSILGISLVLWQWGRARAKATSEAVARRESERASARLTIEQGLAMCDQGDIDRGLAKLVDGCALANTAGDADLERVARINLTAWRQPFNRQRYVCQHGGWVNHACFNRKRTLLLTASEDKTVRLWDASTGQPIGAALRHEHTVDHAVFSPDEQFILTGGGSVDDRMGEACIWEMATGRLVARLPHPGRVSWVEYLPHGRTFLTQCAQQVRIWDADSRSERGEAMTHGTNAIETVCLSQDNRTILTGGTDKTVRQWDAATGKPQGPSLALADTISVMAFCPDGRTIVTGDKSKVAQFWDRDTGAKIGAEMLHNGQVKSVAFSRDGQYLATGSVVNSDPTTEGWRRKTGESRIWRARTDAVWDERTAGKPLRSPTQYLLPVWSLAFSPDGSRLLAGTGDGSAFLLEALSGQKIGNTLGAGGTVRVVEFSDDGRTAMTATAGTTARLWDLAAEPLAAPPLFQDTKMPQIAMHPLHATIAVGDAAGITRLWDLTERKFVGPVLHHGEAIRPLTWSPNGDTLVTIGRDAGVAKFWNPVSGECLKSLSLSGLIRALIYVDGGRTIVTSGSGLPIQLWDAVTFEPKGQLPADVPEPHRIAFVAGNRSLITTHSESPARQWEMPGGKLLRTYQRIGWDLSCAGSFDGKTLVTGSAFGRTAQMWDTATGQAKGPPLPHSYGGQGSVTFSGDGRMAATGGDDHTVRLWDVATGQPLGPPRQLGSTAETVTFTPDGHWIVGSGSGGARVWKVPAPAEGSIDDVRAAIAQLIGAAAVSQ